MAISIERVFVAESNEIHPSGIDKWQIGSAIRRELLIRKGFPERCLNIDFVELQRTNQQVKVGCV